MDSTNTYSHIGIIGAGSFGTALANLVSINENVLIYARSAKRIKAINEEKLNAGQVIRKNIRATNSIEEITASCRLLLPVVPSKSFKNMLQEFSGYLSPKHVLIHGTKGLDVKLEDGTELEHTESLSKDKICTMSQLIANETSVVRVGCLAGPNLARELSDGQPAGALVASPFSEVVDLGTKALNSEKFKIFASTDILGAEYAGILKNIYAIAAGILGGIGFGNNAQALLLTKSLHEMLHIGQFMGADKAAFLGIAGIGDLIATCSSELSRNYTVGKRIANGESLTEILDTSYEVAEGVRTIKIFKLICDNHSIQAPITHILHSILFENKPIEKAMSELMGYNFNEDVTFMRDGN